MYFLQSLIIGAVVIHNEYNHWTPNKYAAAIIGISAAYVVTLALFYLRQFISRAKLRKMRER